LFFRQRLRVSLPISSRVRIDLPKSKLQAIKYKHLATHLLSFYNVVTTSRALPTKVMNLMQNSFHLPFHTRPAISIAPCGALSIETGFQNSPATFECPEGRLAVTTWPAQSSWLNPVGSIRLAQSGWLNPGETIQHKSLPRVEGIFRKISYVTHDFTCSPIHGDLRVSSN
jgi:hypothetical protein